MINWYKCKMLSVINIVMPALYQNVSRHVIFTSRNYCCGKVMFCTDVCHSFCPSGGGCIPACNRAGGVSTQGRGVCPVGEGGLPKGVSGRRMSTTHPSPRRSLKWEVRILLECILVLLGNSMMIIALIKK